MTLFETISINETLSTSIELFVLFFIVMLNVIMLIVITLNVIMVIVIRLSVMALWNQLIFPVPVWKVFIIKLLIVMKK